jgi:hypothetical protein
MDYEYKKQVSVDSLLGVHDKHEITCPRINPLQFDTECATKIYKVSLDFDPSDLKLNLTELFKAMNDLDKWSTDILAVLNNLPEIKKYIILSEAFLTDHEYTQRLEDLEIDHKPEITEYAESINGLIEEWQTYRNDYAEAHTEELKQQTLLEEQEKELLFLKLNGKDLEDCMGLIEFYKDEVYEQTEKKDDAKTNFERYVKDDFEKQVKQFSYFLEDVRNRNDDLRCGIGEIKTQMEKHVKELLNIYQPDEYLDLKFGIQPSVANLGVLFNDTETDTRNEKVNFKSFALGMRAKRFITFEQLNTLIDLNEKEVDNTDHREVKKSAILDMLKTNGVITIRYYNDQKEYAKNRDAYTEQQLNAPLYKPKFKNG